MEKLDYLVYLPDAHLMGYNIEHLNPREDGNALIQWVADISQTDGFVDEFPPFYTVVSLTSLTNIPGMC
jgi:hypothetical protein